MKKRTALLAHRWKIMLITAAVAVAAALPLTSGSTFALFSTASTNSGNSFATLSVRAPSLTAATTRAAGAIKLTWTASPTASIRAVKYLVLRRPSGFGSYSQVTGSPITGLTYMDSPPVDGLYDYVVETYVNGFNSVNSNSITGRSDRTAPVSSVTCNAGSCSGAFSSTVNVAISATDAGSGVASITYSVNGGPATTVAGSGASFTVSTLGSNTVDFHATDNAGNAEASKTATISITGVTSWAVCDLDGVAPTVQPDWLRQGGKYIVYANVVGATGVTANVGSVGSAAFASGIALSSGSFACAGTSYNYGSAQQTAPNTLTAGTNTVFADIVASNGAATAHTNQADAGDVSVDIVAPTDPSVPTGTTPRPGEIDFDYTGFNDATSGIAGYELIILDQTAGFSRPPNYPSNIVVGRAVTTYQFTGLIPGHVYDIGVIAADNAGNNSLSGTLFITAT